MEAYVNSLINKLKISESFISSVLGVGVVLVIGIILYNVFSSRASVNPDTFESPGDTKIESNIQLDNTPAATLEGEIVNVPDTHTVTAGETLWSIAENYYGSGYNWVDIVSENENLSATPNLIESGQSIKLARVPAKQKTVIATAQSATVLSSTSVNSSLTITDTAYTVQKGDTLWNIAVRAYSDGYQWPKLYEANKEAVGANPNIIEPDTSLSIPRD